MLSLHDEEQTYSGSFYMYGTVFIDVSEMKEFLGNSAAARRFVLAHEVGHHIQNLLTDLDMVRERRRKMVAKGDVVGANRLNIRLELQADYYAGGFCRYLNKISQDREIEYINVDGILAIIKAVNNMGDDVLLEENYRAEISDHGTAEQRKRWFWHGYNDDNFKRKEIYELRDDQL